LPADAAHALRLFDQNDSGASERGKRLPQMGFGGIAIEPGA
jgi:hypothetical protein